MDETLYFIYARKSTDDEGRQVLSLDSQENELTELAQREGLKVVEILREARSARTPGRPVFDSMLERIQSGEATGIIAWKLDRLSRNSVDSGAIQWLLQNEVLSHIKTPERDYHPEDNVLMATLEFGMANQYIRDLSRNVKRGLKTKNDMGVRPGRAPIGYLNRDKRIVPDPERFEFVKRMWNLMLTGNHSAIEVLRIATDEWGLRTCSGKKIARSAVYTIFANPFFYGPYEYGGITWNGTHEPMITEDEFYRVQQLLGSKGRPRPQLHKEFDFTGLMRCGNCNAAITAEEKRKRLKDGGTKLYVYYHCTKRKDPNCPERSIELAELSRQVDGIIATLSISDRFKDWAIKHLHEVRKNQTITTETAFTNKQMQLERVIAQLHALQERLISPENANGAIISDTEYLEFKTRLIGQKQALEKALAADSKTIEGEVELTERTFNFARYARLWFKNGDRRTRRAIFAALGSNLLLADQKVAIKLHPVFETIAANLVQIENELENVRTGENLETIGRNAPVYAFSPTLLGVLDEVRTYWQHEGTRLYIPLLSDRIVQI
jgi:site-specific DNA recombinase